MTVYRVCLRLAQGGRSRPRMRPENACILFVRGRWHPASIAGVVVAAMGVIVFGLYLRSYLGARRSAAATGTMEPTENGPRHNEFLP
ncbi:MAG: hypothetical protein ACYTKD_12230 [Planctomycetota bacterium]